MGRFDPNNAIIYELSECVYQFFFNIIIIERVSHLLHLRIFVNQSPRNKDDDIFMVRATDFVFFFFFIIHLVAIIPFTLCFLECKTTIKKTENNKRVQLKKICINF